MKKKSVIIFCLLISINILISTQFVSADLVQDWQVEQNGEVKSIGVDNENNLLLYYLGADDDLSKTWLIKYSISGEVVYNDSLDFGYGYFLYTKKWMDDEGKLYLVDSFEDIYIFIYDNTLTPLKYLFINESDFEGTGALCNVFITNVGNIYLRASYYTYVYNSTHFEKKDHLFKIDSEGNFIWTLNFHTYIKPSAQLDNFVSANDQDYCYFSYQNMLYKIKSSNGKIVWEKEFLQNIKGIAASINGIAVVSGEGSKYAPLTLQYLSTKGAQQWSKTINSDYGYLNLKKIDIKEYSICLSVSDLGDDGEHGEGADRLFIYNLDGEELGNQKWEYWSYFWDRKHIHLTNNNSVFVHNIDYLAGLDTFTYIAHFSFENNMTTITPANGFSMKLVMYVIIVVSIAKQNFRKQLKKS